MSHLTELKKEILSLPAAEREHLALIVSESRETDIAATNRLEDPEGVALALQRDAEIESGSVKSISHTEFLRRTGGGE